MTSATRTTPSQHPPVPRLVVGAPEAAVPGVEVKPLRAQCEIDFETARQSGDRLGMAIAVDQAWRNVTSGTSDPEKASGPDNFADLSSYDQEAVKVAWGLRNAYVDECNAWEDAHWGTRRPWAFRARKTKHEVEGPGGTVKYDRWEPELVTNEDQSNVNPTPIIFIGGYGTDRVSVRRAAKKLSKDSGRTVIVMDEPKPKRGRPEEKPVHDDINPHYNGKARNLSALVEHLANGDPEFMVDVVAQSGSLHPIVALLDRVKKLAAPKPGEPDERLPLRIRKVLLDSSTGFMEEDTPEDLRSRFIKDALKGTPSYRKDPVQLGIYGVRFARNMKRQGLKRDLDAISGSRIYKDALRRLRAHGAQIHQLSARGDTVFPIDEVHGKIGSDGELIPGTVELDGESENGTLIIGNVDSTAARNGMHPHGALLFENGELGMGTEVIMQMLEGYRSGGSLRDIAARFARAQEARKLKKRLMIAGAIALVSAGISYFVLPALFGGHEASGTLAKIPGADGGTAHTPTGGEGAHPPVDPTGGATGGEVVHTPTTTIVAGEGQTVWQNFANVFGGDQAMAKIIEAGHAYASAHEGVTFHVVNGSGAVYFDTPDGPVWGAPELTKMLASAL